MLIAGNWKMNKTVKEALSFIEECIPMVEHQKNTILLCVPAIALERCTEKAKGTNIKIGAQNVHWEEKGAFTGEISPRMLTSIGVEYVIVGHSERRTYFAETDETVNKKVKALLKNDLKPIVCVGESEAQREAGKTHEVITSQVEKALEGVGERDVEKLIFAYEPLWAIGTGTTATKEQANEVCLLIRRIIAKNYVDEVASDACVLYGGSVNPKNAKELFLMPNINGALVGGASLEVEKFVAILECAN